MRSTPNVTNQTYECLLVRLSQVSPYFPRAPHGRASVLIWLSLIVSYVCRTSQLSEIDHKVEVYKIIAEIAEFLERLFVKNIEYRASLVAQWLRICLPMQGTRVRALVWEDPTCRGATRPVSHNY